MKEYQSFGAGVNSVALAEILPKSVERVFSDPGAEDPDTYAYLDYYLQTGRPLTWLHPIVEGCSDIVEWCHKNKMPPLRMYRSCSDKWKHKQLERYFEKPCVINIGIAYDERHRARVFEKKNITYRYPLVEQEIDREGCIEIIKDAGLKVPPKSGCYICPFQSKGAWWRLGRQHPDLFWKAVEVDELSENIGLRQEPGDLRKLWPPQNVFYEDEGWECQHCIII